MGNGSWFVLLVRIAYGLYVWIRERGRKTHDASVRADGGTAWLQQRGGVDKRPCPGPDDAGGDHGQKNGDPIKRLHPLALRIENQLRKQEGHTDADDEPRH